MKKNLKCVAVSICAAVAVLSGCSASKMPPPQDAYFSVILTDSTGSPGGSFTFGIGLFVVERATGDVYFCNSNCSKMGHLEMQPTDQLKGYQVEGHVLIANETHGRVDRCSASFEQKKGTFGWNYPKQDSEGFRIFKSGECTAASVHPVPRA